MVTWGNARVGGDSEAVACELTSDVSHVFSVCSEFAALRHGVSITSFRKFGLAELTQHVHDLCIDIGMVFLLFSSLERTPPQG